MKDFRLVDSFKGYVNSTDVTNLDPRFLVAPSQNVIINDGEKVVTRNGYSLYGAADSTTLLPVQSSFEWTTSTGTEIPLRAYDDELEFAYGGTWYRLQNSYTSVAFSFTTWWDATAATDKLIFVNGTSDLHTWTGAITTFASATAATITKEGTNTWAQDRFLTAGTRQVTIGGTVYTYTGGESTTTLTGVTPDPTLGAYAAGAVVFQTLIETANKPAATSFTNDIVSTLKNQLYVGSYKYRDVYVSKSSDYSDFAYTATRLPGEGALLTLDATPVAFAPQEEDLYIGTKDGWFRTSFRLSADNTSESLTVERLKASRAKAPYAQSSVAKAGNFVIYFTNEKTLDSLGRVENIDTPESRPLSDAIRDELLGYDLTVAPHIRYHDNQLIVVFPSEGKMLIYDFYQKLWQPPQTFPVRRVAVIGGLLCGHSNAVAETYTLFAEDVYADNGSAVDARCALAYQSYGARAWPKTFDEWYTELYKLPNSVVTLTLKYDFGGSTKTASYEIGDLAARHVFATVSDGSLGKWPVGSQPIGSVTDQPDDLEKVRVIHTAKAADVYEVQAVYSSDDVDQRWQLVATGGNVKLSRNDNVNIKA